MRRKRRGGGRRERGGMRRQAELWAGVRTPGELDRKLLIWMQPSRLERSMWPWASEGR